jgi:uncharacterized protein (TIGR02271 family)
MTHTVVGLFDNRSSAGAATQELIQKGFMRENIDVSNRRTSDASTEIAVTETGVGESIGNFFNSLFGSDKTTARNYANVARDADAIISVQVDSPARAMEAAAILDRHGAIDVDARSAQFNQTGSQQNQVNNQQNFANTSTTAPNTANNQGATSIPIIEEQIQIGKQVVEQGGTRLRSRIIEKPVEAALRLRQEHVVVNRRPVNREVTEADLANFREGEIVITEHAEVPVIGKQARVVEEVIIGKNVTEHEEVIREVVRRNEVEVEPLDNELSGDINTRRANS